MASGVTDFLRTHPQGFDLQVGERGMALSGGQRQAVVIARSLLLDPPIVLLDEPTSHMDNSTEAQLKERLGQILPGKTVVLITHRSSLLSLVDRLIILDKGRVVADGPKEDVLNALKKGQVKATASAATTSMPSSRARDRMAAPASSASAIDIFTLAWAMPSVPYRTMPTVRAPASRANS